MHPEARTERLVVERLNDEVVVYDLANNRAHCLNRTAALVWEHCNGRTTIPQIAAMLQRDLALPPDEELVETALRDLARVGLLREQRAAELAGRPKVSRRELARRLGLGGGMALALPLIHSILAPAPAEAVRCVTEEECERRRVQRWRRDQGCGDAPICGKPGRRCVYNPSHQSCSAL